jgi:hypothetical protein
MNWVSLKLVVTRLKESVERNYYLSRNDEAEQAHERLIEAEFKLRKDEGRMQSE